MVAIKHIKKGELLIKEGEASANMYWLQSGSMRLYKKKGDGVIELGVLHSGELVGEMSFLDNKQRSASVEALQKCDVIEIPRGKFDEVMETLPSWLHSLVGILVKRLRTANNRIRELESNSMVYTSGADGKSTKHHEFVSINELLRLCSALVVTGTRRGEKNSLGRVVVNRKWIDIYSHQIMNVSTAKVAAFLEIMKDAGVLELTKVREETEVSIISIDFIERFLHWLNDENLKDENKQLKIGAQALVICDYIYQFGNLEAFADDEVAKLNIQQIYLQAVKSADNKYTFDWKAFEDLVKAEIATELQVENESEKFSEVNLVRFKGLYPFLNLRQRFIDMNEVKRAKM